MWHYKSHSRPLPSNDEKELTVIELTVPFELNIEKAHSLKTNKYSPLISDIESNNVKTKFVSLEIGSRGYIDNENNMPTLLYN